MSTETNKAIVRKFIDALFTDGDLTATDDYLAAEFVNHDPPVGVAPDAAGMRAAGALFRAGFPDWRSELYALIAEDDIVVERFTASGTHKGEIFGVAPTGKTVVLEGINIFRISGDRITERWGRLDELG